MSDLKAKINVEDAVGKIDAQVNVEVKRGEQVLGSATKTVPLVQAQETMGVLLDEAMEEAVAALRAHRLSYVSMEQASDE